MVILSVIDLSYSGPSFEGPSHGPPIVVHCSAGVGRSGTFAAIDICMSSILYKKAVNVMQTVRHMRSQRAHRLVLRSNRTFLKIDIFLLFKFSLL